MTVDPRWPRRDFARGVVAAVMIVVLSAPAGCVHRTASQAPHMWQLRGAVVALQDGSVRVRHKSGQVIPIALDDETAYFTHNRPASRQQVTVGARVMVDVQRSGGFDRAVRVQIF